MLSSFHSIRATPVPAPLAGAAQGRLSLSRGASRSRTATFHPLKTPFRRGRCVVFAASDTTMDSEAEKPKKKRKKKKKVKKEESDEDLLREDDNPIVVDEMQSSSKSLSPGAVLRKLVTQKPQAESDISYAQMLEYAVDKRIRNLTIYDGGKEAIVEVCIPGYEGEPDEKMEKAIFSCKLPGDYHEEVLKLAKKANSRSTGPERGNVMQHFSIADPHAMYPPIVTQTASYMVPIVAFAIFQQVLEFVQWLQRGGKRRKTKELKMAEEFGESKAQLFDDSNTTGVTFKDVAGVDHAVNGFKEIIAIMNGDPQYQKVGANMPKGILLQGPPGTGKTLLAKAIAGEAGVPFYSCNGSEFVEMFVGVAAARVRNLFSKARKNTPAIIFIDEIDTIGRAREDSGPSLDGSNEAVQGLMQLLVEMDGFTTKEEKVLVIGATNLASTLDDALLRSGRFDRVVELGLPSEPNRLKILQVHAEGKKLNREGDEEFEDDALLRRIAQLTVGFSGAELANMLNEAAIIAVRGNKDTVGMTELEAAMDKMKLGLVRPPLEESEEKRKLSYVEAGRAVLTTLMNPITPDVLQVSVAPRGNSKSRVVSVSLDSKGLAHLYVYNDYIDMMSIVLAGRATEEVVYGQDGVSVLTSRELSAATLIATQLVCASGLHPGFENLPITGKQIPKFQRLQDQIDIEVQKVSWLAYTRARQKVQENRAAIDAIAEELVRRDTVYGSELRKLVAESPKAVVQQPCRPGVGYTMFGDNYVDDLGDYRAVDKQRAGKVGSVFFTPGATPDTVKKSGKYPPMEDYLQQAGKNIDNLDDMLYAARIPVWKNDTHDSVGESSSDPEAVPEPVLK